MAYSIANAAAKVVNLAGGIVAAGMDIEGGYFTIDILNNIPAYANVKGTLCYCTGTEEEPINKFYQYDGSDWVERKFSATTVSANAENGCITIDGEKTTVYKHPTGNGNNHIPSGGATNNVLRYNSAGSAKWEDIAYTSAPEGNGAASAGSANTFSRGDHVHPLQENISGQAGSAKKLDANAGSATQPIYFANGVPVATTHTLDKSVPSEAIFTDHNVASTQRTTDTTNYYLTGVSGATTGIVKYDTGIKMGNANGELVVRRCNVNTSEVPVGIEYDGTRKALKFIVN